MQTRPTKVFLPQSYEQYLAQKKKMNRLTTNKHVLSHQQTFTSINIPTKQNNFLGKNESYRSNIQTESLLSPKFLPGSKVDPNQDSNKLKKSNFSDQSEDENEQNSNRHHKKQTVIVQKIVFSEYKNLFQEFENCKFDAIKRKIELQLEKLKEKTPLQPIKVNQILKKIELQSLQNIVEIEKQLQLPFGKRNTQKLDSMLNFNKFFLILNKEKRVKIYQNCIFKRFKPNETIYREGQANQYMYVVLKGCVKQYETKSTSYQEKVEVNFMSYYQGSNFGEAPLIGDSEVKSKRYNTTITTEQTYLLLLQNNFYKDLITNSAEDDFEKKIQALMQTSIFRETSKIFVTPLLPTLTKHILPYGTVLIRQGEQVHSIYFVAEGNLEVMLLDRARRNIKHLNIQQKPKNIYIKKSDVSASKNRTNKQKQKSFSIHTQFYYPQNSEQKQRKEFLYGNKKLIGQDEIQYNDQIVFQTLRMGDFLGGKSFLQQIDRQRKMMNSEYFDTSLVAKLSVLSSSPKTIVYSIDEKKFFSLSDSFQKMIIEGIMQGKYFDEYDIDSKVNEQKQWKKYSQKLVNSVIISKKNTRSSSFRT